MPGMDTKLREKHRGTSDNGGRYAAHERDAGSVELTGVDDAHVISIEGQRINGAIGSFRNALGEPLTEENRAAMLAVAAEVTDETWRGAYSKVINGSTTLWQAVNKHTDADIRTGPVTAVDVEGAEPFRPTTYKEVSGWPELPTTEQVRAAVLAESKTIAAG